jgi:hypothetical protein
MIDVNQIRSHIKDTLDSLGSKYASDDAIELVLTTGIVESGYRYIRQISGPAKGFYQVEPKSAYDNVKSYLSFRKTLAKKCADISYTPKEYWTKGTVEDWEKILEGNITAGILHCRLKYWRSPGAIPSTTEGMAEYWKKNYNSELGAGTIGHYMDAVTKYLGT